MPAGQGQFNVHNQVFICISKWRNVIGFRDIAESRNTATTEFAPDDFGADAGLQHSPCHSARSNRIRSQAALSPLGVVHCGRCLDRAARAAAVGELRTAGLTDQMYIPHDERPHLGGVE